MEERPFTRNESYLMHHIIRAITLYAPHIEPKSLFVDLNELMFEWKKLPERQMISHLNWWASVVSVAPPKEGEDIKVHLIAVVPRFLQQLYVQMDYKRSRLRHLLHFILYHDQYGEYRKQFEQAIRFYRQLRIAYTELSGYNELGKMDLEAQYELRKELHVKYGRAFQLALEIQDHPL